MPGLYKKRIHGISSQTMADVNEYFTFVQSTVRKYLPKCLVDALNDALNKIGLEDFSKLGSYKEMKVLNKGNSFENSSINSNQISYSFMPSASFGCNNLLSLHTDEDMFLSVIHVHAKSDITHCQNYSQYESNTSIVKYFSFNDGTSVALRSGDILIFNPTIPHCVSSNTDDYSDDDVYCISHYFKTLVVSRNNNKIAFDQNVTSTV